VVDNRERIDALIERVAPAYPVVQLARMDRTLLRSGIGEVLHSGTPPRWQLPNGSSWLVLTVANRPGAW